MMAPKFGPSRNELLFRVAVSAFGLGLLGVALMIHGLPGGPALVEVVGVGGAFFGGTLGFSLWKLIKRDHPE